MSGSEKHWALKSANLKRVKDHGKKDVINRTLSRNSVSNKSDSSLMSSQYGQRDIRKSSYPILPNPPLFIKPETINNRNYGYSSDVTEKWDNESNNTSDYGSDISLKKSPRHPEVIVPRVIDSRYYRNYLSEKRPDVPHNHRKAGVSSSPISKQYLLKQKQQITRTRATSGINLNIFHAMQLISFEIIDEALEEDIVPDILIDAFKEIQYNEERLKKQIVPLVRSTAEQIMNEVIDQYIQETVLVIVLRDSKNQLQSQIIYKWILDGILPALIADVSQDAVRDIANEKMKLSRSNYVFEKLSTEFIRQEITKSESILFQEVMLELMLEECVIDPVIAESLTSVSNNMISYYHEKVSRINLQQVTEMTVKEPLGCLIIDHLVSVGMRQKMTYGPSLVGQCCFEHIVFDILLGRTYEIYDTLMNTVDNSSLRRWHQAINQSTVTDILVKELLEHSDADLCDLDAEEVEENHIPRYINNIDEVFFR